MWELMCSCKNETVEKPNVVLMELTLISCCLRKNQILESYRRSAGILFFKWWVSPYFFVDEDAYLLEVGRYIHRNPAEVSGANEGVLSSYRWSSYPSYINEAAAPDWLHREKTYQMLAQKNRYVGYRNFVLQGNDADTADFYGKGNTGSIFGDKSFRQAIIEEKDTLKVTGHLARALSERPSMARIVEAVATFYGTEKHAILAKAKGRPRRNVPRQVAMYCCQLLGGHSLVQIASYFSLTNAGSASPAIQVVRNGLQTGESRVEVKKIEDKL